MTVVYDVMLSTSGSLASGGILSSDVPLVEGQRVEHYDQQWLVERIDEHQRPPVLTLRAIRFGTS